MISIPPKALAPEAAHTQPHSHFHSIPIPTLQTSGREEGKGLVQGRREEAGTIQAETTLTRSGTEQLKCRQDAGSPVGHSYSCQNRKTLSPEPSTLKMSETWDFCSPHLPVRGWTDSNSAPMHDQCMPRTHKSMHDYPYYNPYFRVVPIVVVSIFFSVLEKTIPNIL